MQTYHHLNLNERQIIYRLKRQGESLRAIAKVIGRDPSTISREMKRNRGGFGYNCREAEGKARWRKISASRERRKIKGKHRQIIVEGIESKHSPEQIASQFPSKAGFSIVPSTIYRWINRYHDGGRLNLKQRLRRKGIPYKKGGNRGNLPKRTFIDDRPKSVENNRFYGDWEVDLMVESSSTSPAVLVITERKSFYTLIRLVPNKRSATVSSAIMNTLGPFKVRTLTYDNGSEFAKFETVEKATKSKAFFCHPYSSWEKGLVENTIGLLREYFPKGSIFPEYQIDFTRVQIQLNQRPRKGIGFQTSEELISRIKK